MEVLKRVLPPAPVSEFDGEEEEPMLEVSRFSVSGHANKQGVVISFCVEVRVDGLVFSCYFAA